MERSPPPGMRCAPRARCFAPARIAPGAAALLAACLLAAPAPAAEDSYMISIKDHRFDPAEIAIPAGKRVKLVVKNMDATPEEFESRELNIEKIITGGAEGAILIGPLEAGTYPFVGEFHEKTAKGRIVVK